jgi:cyclic pyranopterin monophosphate synthase
VSDEQSFPHLDEAGRARMVDVAGKPATRRTARAEGEIRMRAETLRAIRERSLEKGDALAVARIAAIGGAKRTADLVPLCHPLPLDGVRVEIEEIADPPGLRLAAETTTEARTGVEMEALCAVTAGLLAVYDMCKGLDRGMEIGPIRLVSKRGGRSGAWSREDGGPFPSGGGAFS